MNGILPEPLEKCTRAWSPEYNKIYLAKDPGSIQVRVPPDSTKGCDCYFWAFPKGSPVTSWRATGLPFV